MLFNVLYEKWIKGAHTERRRKRLVHFGPELDGLKVLNSGRPLKNVFYPTEKTFNKFYGFIGKTPYLTVKACLCRHAFSLNMN